MKWLPGLERGHLVVRAPGQKVRHGPGVGPARVRVADRRGEELEETHRRALAASNNHCRDCSAFRSRQADSFPGAQDGLGYDARDRRHGGPHGTTIFAVGSEIRLGTMI
jgi:hypothetical protein